MAMPQYNELHYDAILSNLSVAILQEPSNFIATKVFPIVPVARQSDKYYVFDREWFLRDDMQVRQPGTESAGTGFHLSRDSYFANLYAIHHDVSWQNRANADAVLDLDRAATRMLMAQVQQKLERTFVANYMKTGVWGADYAGKAANPGAGEFYQWSDYTNSNPVTDIDTASDAILKATGMTPNTLILGQKTFRAIQRHPILKDQFKYTSSDSITAEMIGAVLNVPQVYVAKAIKATNAEGQTLTTDFIAGKSAWLGYVAAGAGLETASAGYTFNWQQYVGGSLVQAPIFKIPMQHLKADRLETEVGFDMKVVAPSLGVYFDTAVA